ncbi:hypothetical protein BGZ76_011796 [Entomortierella beljakovae]|nr:hypothetical protein BGZ76_011796 [Entomortierella beljakovae]
MLSSLYTFCSCHPIEVCRDVLEFMTQFIDIVHRLNPDLTTEDIKWIIDLFGGLIKSRLPQQKRIAESLKTGLSNVTSSTGIMIVMRQPGTQMDEIQREQKAAKARGENPIPRYFIIVPEQPGILGQMTPSTVKPCRVFFICECIGCQAAHLSYHPGYKLDKPTKFIRHKRERFMGFLTWLSRSLSIGGLIGPNTSSGIKMIANYRDKIEMSNKNFTEISEHSVYFKSRQGSLSDEEFHSRENICSAASDPKLEYLKEFLQSSKVAPKNGNLNSTEYQESILWMCDKHTWKTESEDSQSSILDNTIGMHTPVAISIVTKSGGEYLEEMGVARITLKSRDDADKFYRKITDVNVVKDIDPDLVLDVSLDWKVKVDDLESFSKMARKSKILHLAVTMTNDKSVKAKSIINHWSKSGLKSLELRNFKFLFPKGPKYPWIPSWKIKRPKFNIGSKKEVDDNPKDKPAEWKLKIHKKYKKVKEKFRDSENKSITMSSQKLHKILKRMAALSLLIEKSDCDDICPSNDLVFKLERTSLGSSTINLYRDDIEVMKGTVTFAACKNNEAGTLLYQLTSVALNPTSIGTKAPDHLKVFLRLFPFVKLVEITHNEATEFNFQDVIRKVRSKQGKRYPSVDVSINGYMI